MLHRIGSICVLAIISVAYVLYSRLDVQFDKPLDYIILILVVAPVTYGLLKLWDLIQPRGPRY